MYIWYWCTIAFLPSIAHNPRIVVGLRSYLCCSRPLILETLNLKNQCCIAPVSTTLKLIIEVRVRSGTIFLSISLHNRK